MSVEFPIVSIVSALLVLVPLPWHWRAHNVCTTSAILWLAICNINRGINTIIWIDNIVVRYKVFCEFAARTYISANIGVPASTVCICRRLAQASAPYHRAPTPEEKRQRMKFELSMCVVLPIIFNGLHIIVEPCRFAIVEEFGCNPCYYPSVLGLLIAYVPPILLSFAASIYSGVALRWLIHRRVQFRRAAGSAQQIATSGRYIRLAALAITLMTCASVMSLFLMISSIQYGVVPWISWEHIHQDWQKRIILTPKNSIPKYYWTTELLGWYFVPISSIVLFGFFGFDDRVVREYKSMLTWIRVHILRIKDEKGVVLPLSADVTTAIRE